MPFEVVLRDSGRDGLLPNSHVFVRVSVCVCTHVYPPSGALSGGGIVQGTGQVAFMARHKR